MAYRDLEIDEEMGFQRVGWRLERVGWVVFALIIVAALAGLCGPGPLSSSTTREGSVEVQYDRLLRLEAQVTLAVTGVPEGGELHVTLSSAYLEDVRIEEVIPEPASVETAADHVVYTFAAAADAEELRAVFVAKPERIGRLRGEAGVEGGPSVSFTQYVFP
ncbi:MAG: hypothetical protein IT303_10650 [Dehalococcoidia bacterium]|nr:hypothetical protein [Dehalococcoidia bacterium]